MTRRPIPAAGAVLLAVCLALSAAAQTPAPTGGPGRPLPTDSAVRIGTLDNGLRYYVRVNREPRNRAELRLVVNAGSVLESDDQRGLAHLLEHMAFNGTRNFAEKELVSFLERSGMRFGPDVNAYTGFDETVYMLTLPTDSTRIFERGFQILEDWAHGITIDSVEVEKERGVVIEEWRQGQGASTRIRNKQFPILLRGSLYAERLPIGILESLERASASAIRRFYHEWYRPDLMAVVVVGDFDPDRVEGLIRDHFSKIARPSGARERPVPPVPDHAEPLVAIATDREASATRIGVLYKQPVRVLENVGQYRRGLVEDLFNGMLNDRFAELVTQPDPPFVNAFSGQGRFVRSKEVYELGAIVPENGIERGLEALLTEAERVARHGFAPSELERQKSQLLRGMERAFAEREKTRSESYAQEYVSHFLNGDPIPSIATEFELTRALVPGIAVEEVNALAREWLVDQNRVVMVSSPEKAGVTVPDERSLLAIFDRMEGKEVTAYRDAVSDAPLLAPPARKGSISSVRTIPEVGVTEWRLSNGARVLLKPTDFRADQILFSAYSPGGFSLVDEASQIPALTATLAVETGGLGQLGQVELAKRLSDKAIRLSPLIGTTEEGFSGSASPRDLETFFQVLHLYFTGTRRDSASFEAIRARVRASLQNAGATPERAFADTLQVVLAQHHPRARPFRVENVDDMDLDRSLAVYRDRFADAGDFTFVFVGSFQPDSLRPLVETYLATLPAVGRKESWRDLGIDYPTGVVRKEVRRGVEPKSQSRFVFTGPFEYSRENLAVMEALEDILSTRLRDDLREDQSGTYGVQVSSSAARVPDPTYRFDISFGSSPERRTALEARVLAHIDSLQATPPSLEEVASVQAQQRRELETNRRENGYWLGVIGANDRLGWDVREELGAEARIAALTPQVVQAAARRYLDRSRYVHAWLVPENQPAAAPAR